MRWIIVLALSSLPLSLNAEEPSVEIGGQTITRGMPEDDIRSAFQSVYCAANASGVDHGIEFCLLEDGESWENSGEISFENGSVRRATRNWRTSENPETYELFILLNELLTQLTKGTDTCATIYTYSHGPQAPKGEVTMIVLPKKFVAITTHLRGDQRSVSIQESLRVNPVPSSYKVYDDANGNGRCAFAE